MLRVIKSLTLVMAIVLILSVVGVYSTWQYAQGEVVPTWTELKLSVFPWEGSDILPEEDQIGQNHRTLIDTIINGPGIGLNTSGSYLNEEIEYRRKKIFLVKAARDTLGSMAISQGDELNELFSLNSAGLEFLIRFVSDTEYEIYTTGVELGENGNPATPLGQRIYPIYKTQVLFEDGVWVAKWSKVGSAESAYYEESQLDYAIQRSKIPSFDPETWVESDPTA